METKVCKKCNIEKSIDGFYVDKRNKSGVMGSCKDCYYISQKKWKESNPDKCRNWVLNWRKNNPEKVKEISERWVKNNPEKAKESSKQWKKNNTEKINENKRNWYKNNAEKVNESCKQWKTNNIEKVKENVTKWHKSNPDRVKNIKLNWKKNNPDKIKDNQRKQRKKPKTKMSNNVRKRLSQYLKLNNISKKNKTFEIIGCTPEFLKEHIQSQFKDNMSWENYGYYGWHIDHKIPLSSAKTEEELYKLCHYTNLQPLWVEENLKKGNKIIV